MENVIGKTYTVNHLGSKHHTVEYIKTVEVKGKKFEIRKVPSFGNVPGGYQAFLVDEENQTIHSTWCKASKIEGVEDCLKYWKRK